MTLTTKILQASISSSKKTIPKTISTSSPTIVLPLSSMAVAYASSLPSKPLVQDHLREQKKPNRLGGERTFPESKTNRFYYGSSALRSQPRLPVIIEASSIRTIDPFLGNLLDGFCNGSCYKTNTR